MAIWEGTERLVRYISTGGSSNNMIYSVEELSPNNRFKQKNAIHKTQCRFCNHYPFRNKCKLEG